MARMVLFGMALAYAGKWDAEPADVVAAKVLPVSREQVHALLADWRGWKSVLPESCATDWEIPSRSTGIGARARALYTIGPLRRRLIATYTKDQPGLVLETEAEGKKGWFTQVTYRDAPNGVEVRINTPITPPKWPFTGVYFEKVRPAWEDCYAQALDRIPGAVQ